MKERIFTALIFCCLSTGLWGQVEFSGEVQSTITANFEEDYESLINPGNAGGLQDLTWSPSALFKLEGGEGATGFRLWFTLARYPIGTGLLTAATDVSDPLSLSLATASEFVAFEGDVIYALGIQRFLVEGEVLPELRFSLGRQDLSLSYGFGWNPLNLASGTPVLQGLEESEAWNDGLSLSWALLDNAELRLYGLLPPQALQVGLAWEDLQGGQTSACMAPAGNSRLSAFGTEIRVVSGTSLPRGLDWGLFLTSGASASMEKGCGWKNLAGGNWILAAF
jgi:hypothetical protein